jgi:TRAP-type C4-dicarboxylate transport system permease small subunit
MFRMLLASLMAVAAASIAFITIAICYSVVMRRSFSMAPFWVNDITAYVLLGITFAGGAYVAAKDGHTTVDLLTQRLSPGYRRIAGIFSSFVCFAASTVLGVTAALVAFDHFERSTRVIRAVEVPKWLVIFPIFVGATLVAAVFGAKLLGLLRTRADDR